MKKTKRPNVRRQQRLSIALSACVTCYLLFFHFLGGSQEDEVSIGRSTATFEYDPKNCSRLVNGHCDDVDGGAWTYRSDVGHCTYWETTPESNNAPKDGDAVVGLPRVFPEVTSVLDFGGGVGVFLTGFRNTGVRTLVTVEPQPLGDCLFAGIQQDTTDWINTPLTNLPKHKFDLVMSMEVAEHIPVHFHRHILQALAQATSKWLLFSAAHPGQAGEGHVGPSMKWKQQWIHEIHNWTTLRLDESKTSQFHNSSNRRLRMNSAVFRKVEAI